MLKSVRLLQINPYLNNNVQKYFFVWGADSIFGVVPTQLDQIENKAIRSMIYCCNCSKWIIFGVILSWYISFLVSFDQEIRPLASIHRLSRMFQLSFPFCIHQTIILQSHRSLRYFICEIWIHKVTHKTINFIKPKVGCLGKLVFCLLMLQWIWCEKFPRRPKRQSIYVITLSPIMSYAEAMAFNQHSTNELLFCTNINKKHKYLVCSLSRLHQYQTAETKFRFLLVWLQLSLIHTVHHDQHQFGFIDAHLP